MKATYHAHHLTMPCCGQKGVPKTSALGTHFFAHARRGSCTTAPESKEHLLAKTIIANTAHRLDWIVTTEHRDVACQGEEWIADVFATKGRIKLAFEIQWSAQTPEETRRRQQRYSQSGVRAAWMVLLNRRREVYKCDLIDEYETPYFGIRLDDPGNNFVVPRFGVELDEFVSGMLTGKLVWGPKVGDTCRAGVIVAHDTCWRCHQKIGVVLGVELFDDNKQLLDFKAFNDPGVPEFVQSVLNPQLMQIRKIGQIKLRYSKTVKERYISNGCFYCDALQGDFFLQKLVHKLRRINRFPTPVIYGKFLLDDFTVSLHATWRFNGSEGKVFY